MIQLKTITHAIPPRNLLVELKQYASVPDDTREALLLRVLTSALLTVQEMADVTLLPSKLEVLDTESEGDVRLYQDPARILEIVADGVTLSPEDYPIREDRRLKVHGHAVRVRYETRVDEGNLGRYLPIVYEYATALYDGADASTLNAILSKC